MELLILLRQMAANNFYRNTSGKPAESTLVLPDLKDHPEYNVGQKYEIISVNRTTGEIGLKEL